MNIENNETNISKIEAAQVPIYTTLHGKYVKLVKLQISDLKPLYELTHGTHELETVWKYLPHGHFESLEEMEDFFDTYTRKGNLVFCVRNINTDTPAGIVCLMDINPKMASIEIGGVLYPKINQKTIANTEATYLLIKYCIEALGFRKIIWKCDSNNQMSANAALRLGFEFEGLFYNHMIVKGRNRDTAWFGITDTKWQLLAKNYEYYLQNYSSDIQKNISLAALNAQLPKFSSVYIDDKICKKQTKNT